MGASAAENGRAAAGEAEFLAAYDPREFPPVAVTVDIVLLTLRHGLLSVLLIRRRDHPYQGYWALPGGFADPDEDLEQAAQRELLEETGLSTFPGHLEQLRTYGRPERDPRMRVISVAYLGMVPGITRPEAGSDAAVARLWPVEDVLSDDEQVRPQLAFDHATIIEDGLERVRSKLEYTSLATAFVEEPFTIADLRRVYETVWGVELDYGNFRRKVLNTDGFVEPTGDTAPTGRGYADLYRAGRTTLLQPAMLRPDSRGR
ncbi:MAG: hypothetical protein JJLCMIEE_01435 [Acidimicrobiales bacterium]|nr:MAG: NUDIX hydrolase [Actinomycetota bacterium]MBV6508375.1 hypothetical protein [Acidimicrobiales bacterium]RIK04808.1 MAG: hypothetical protein DCC48_12250 [Acidobacteriota bacterium]